MTEPNREAPRASVELTEGQIAFFAALVNNQLGAGSNTDEQATMLRDARRRLSSASEEFEGA